MPDQAGHDKSGRRWSGGVAEAFDGFGDVADLGDFEAEVFADFDGLAQADGGVVYHEVNVLISVLIELDDGAEVEFEDFVDMHFFLGDFDDDGDFHAEDSFEMRWKCFLVGLVRVGWWVGGIIR